MRRDMLCAAGLALLLAAPAQAQWVRVTEQFYLPASHNWAFRENYRGADRLFNAFDYGHAILYETLLTRPTAAPAILEEREYDLITRRILVRPPRVPLEEAAIEPTYNRLVPEAKAMFEWAHILHRQIYDVWADERLPVAEKDARVAELVRYYKSRPELAFSSRPKTMELMEGQYYSSVFRQRYPKFNGLIWAYHWMQVGLYDALMAGGTPDERQANVSAAVARFWQMLEDAPQRMPRVMPMTAAVAPRFAARYPEAAIIFDNLHSMHDVVSDILASPQVPPARKRAEILLAAQRYRDDTSFVMTEQAWREMSLGMGAQNMGGVATAVLTSTPVPTVPIGASHAEAMGHGAHGAHGAPGAASPAPDSASSAPGGHGGAHGSPGTSAADSAAEHARAAEELRQRLLADPVIRERVRGDTTLQRLLEDVERQGQPGHHERVYEPIAPDSSTAAPADPHAGHAPATPAPAPAKKAAPAKKSAPAKKAEPARAPKPATKPKPAGGHEHHHD